MKSMEKLIIFNGVKVVLTTGQSMSEVQNFLDEGQVFISVYAGSMKILSDSTAWGFTA